MHNNKSKDQDMVKHQSKKTMALDAHIRTYYSAHVERQMESCKGYVCLKSQCERKLTAGTFSHEWWVMFFFKVRTPFSCATRQGSIEAAEQMILPFSRLSLTPHS